MDYSKLVKSLRHCNADCFCEDEPCCTRIENRDGYECVWTMHNEAADAIEELEKAVEREKTYIQFWQDAAETCKVQYEKMKKKMLNWKGTAEDWRDSYHHWFENYQNDVPRWIPVTERLPKCDLGTEVGNIEWISCGMVHAGCFGRGGKYRDAYFRTWTDAGEGMDAKDADYWRAVALPELPKEETE